MRIHISRTTALLLASMVGLAAASRVDAQTTPLPVAPPRATAQQLAQAAQLAQLAQLATAAPDADSPHWTELSRTLPIAGDPADSLYRLARESLNAGEYRRAAQLFDQLTRRYPKSQYQADAAYWRAFALYRIGGIADLHEALQVLDSAPPTRARGTYTVSAALAPPNIGGGYEVAAVPMPESEAGALATAARMRTVLLNSLGTSDGESALLTVRIRSALAARGDSAAAAQIARTAGAGATSCDEEDAQLRIEALNALVQMDATNAEPAIARVLTRRDECSISLRRGAIALAARTNDARTTDMLISAARGDPSVEVRAEATSALSRSTDERVTNALVAIATSDTSAAMQRIAVRSLAVQKSPASQQALRSLITRADLPANVRVTALHYAGPDALQIADLARMYDAAADRTTREEIVRQLAVRQQPEAADKLIGIARTSTDPDMRRRAIEALSQKKDPRTTKLLMDILNK
jgi:tetratricopeptide (TPR) repeat protein